MAHSESAISRRRFVQTTAASSLALAGMGLGRPAWAQSTKPNIVFILADDLGYADVSCYGQRDYTTPNIDRLAIEGLKFTQAYSNSPDCSATRTALITGRYQTRLPVGLEEPITPLSPKDIGLPPSHPTLPSLLKKAGYGTTLVGKWHLGYLPDFSPLKSGYDHFFGIFGCCADYFNHGADASRAYALPIPGLAHQLHEQEVPVERHGYMTNLLGDRAVQTDRRLRQVEGAVSAKPAFHGAALAMGGAGRRGRVEANQEHHSPRRRHAEDLRRHGAEPGRQYRPRAAGARRERSREQHHRRLHQRQRRRAILQYVAVLRHEARTARRRPSRPGDRALARSISRRDRSPNRS